jgi:tetratricopeptide (TPR) repeat protein
MSSQNPEPGEQATAFRVLTIVARPLDEQELPDIADAWALVDGLTKIEAPALIHFLEPPTIEELRQAVLGGWDVIHFDGHGVAANGGVLAFETEDGISDKLSAQDFAEMLAHSGTPPRLVILSACESANGAGGGLAGVLEQKVPAVIGTKESVSVMWTMTLVRQLYAALGRGRSVRDAYAHARQALKGVPNYNPHSETRSEELPVLLGKGLDAALCDGRLRGEPVVEQPKLYGWTERWMGKFHGDFIGSDAEGNPIDPPEGRKGLIVQTARALLRDEKLVTLTGAGGIGKTALAAKVARNLSWRYPGGVFWVDGRNYLTSTIPLDAVLDEFEHVFGKEFLELSTERKRKQVLAYMNGLKSACLVVLDNADTAREEAMLFLQELPPRSAALLTSRVAPEYGGTIIELKAMSPDESLTFLLAEVGRQKNNLSWYLRPGPGVKAESALADSEWGDLGEITLLLGGHPLALLLAAARIRSDGITRTHAIVREHPALGKELHRRFDFSYTPLADDEKRLLHLIAAFPADFDETALEEVCTNAGLTAGDEPLPNWASGLRELRDKSLVEQFDFANDYRRFRLHPVMRDYVREKLKSLRLAAGEGRVISGFEALSSYEFRVARFYGSLAFGLFKGRNEPSVARLIPSIINVERHNLVNIQDILLSQGRWENAVNITGPLEQLFNRAGYWKERRRALELGMDAAAKSNNQDAENVMKHNLGIVMQYTGDTDKARELFEESHKVFHELGKRNYESESLLSLGTLAYERGEYEEARRLFGDGLIIARDAGDKNLQAHHLNHLGMIARDTGELDAALKYTEEASAISNESSDKVVIGSVRFALGRLAQVAKDFPKARAYYEEALDIFTEVGDLPNSGMTLAQISLLDEEEGKLEDAVNRARRAETIFMRTGDFVTVGTIKAQIERQLNLVLSEELDQSDSASPPVELD